MKKRMWLLLRIALALTVAVLMGLRAHLSLLTLLLLIESGLLLGSLVTHPAIWHSKRGGLVRIAVMLLSAFLVSFLVPGSVVTFFFSNIAGENLGGHFLYSRRAPRSKGSGPPSESIRSSIAQVEASENGVVRIDPTGSYVYRPPPLPYFRLFLPGAVCFGAFGVLMGLVFYGFTHDLVGAIWRGAAVASFGLLIATVGYLAERRQRTDRLEITREGVLRRPGPFERSVSLKTASKIAFEDDEESGETWIEVMTVSGKTKRVLTPGFGFPDEERQRILAVAERFLQKSSRGA